MGAMQKYIFIVFGILASSRLWFTSDNQNDGTGDYFLRFRKVFEHYAEDYLTEEVRKSHNITKMGSSFDCPPSVSSNVPESVHVLRPGDIKVIGAIGDSITTAYAAGASSYNAPVLFEYPGMSASMGGDETLKEIITIPNILREYNPNLYGYSTGCSSVINLQPASKGLNFAISGSYAEDMPEQARTLIQIMKTEPKIDFKNDWKFITILIGANDLCSWCLYTKSTPENYIQYVEKAIQILHDECPRTFVNVIGIFNGDQVSRLRGPFICSVIVGYYCPCALGGSFTEKYIHGNSKEFQRLLRTSIESGKFDDKEDFTAVYQPYLEDTSFVTKPDGQLDRSYFAPDCFHPSQKSQATQAIANWNNLFEPVGSKSTTYNAGGIRIKCPSKDFPYLYTNVNSRPGFLETVDER